MVRLGSALFLGALVAGCGFRSGLDVGDFDVVSFTLDQSSYVQGESGVATATLRNNGPRPASPIEVVLRGEGVASTGFAVSDAQLPEGDIPPGETGVVEWSFTAGEAAEPGTGSAWVKVIDDDGESESEAVPVELFRAATLDVVALDYFANAFVAEPTDYACVSSRPALVQATVHNSGASAANVSGAMLHVTMPDDEVQSLFHLQPFGDAHPSVIAAGATVNFRFELGALAGAMPRSDYSLAFDATVTDATTGHARPEPSQDEALNLALTVHTPAGFALTVTEAVDMFSTAAPGPMDVTIRISNTGTVAARVDDGALQMFVGASSTSDEYGQGAPNITLPVTLQGGEEVSAVISVTLTSATPTLGTTAVHGLASGADLGCFGDIAGNSEAGLSQGSWMVQ